jgi:serine/threonine-protein kinase
MLPAPLNQKFGRYELLTLLARGGMAEVFLARMTGAGGFAKLLVIKRILPHLRDDPEFHEMFLNEGRIAARLSHPNVCHVYELDEVDGDMYLAMEYLDGLVWADLAPKVPRTGAFQLRCAAAVIGQVCDGLHYAHELRDVDGTPTPVVHRDVSPQNVMITTDGVCKLLDFGVSKLLTEGTRTRTGMLKGKLPYMAPEQIRGEPVDARADVFSMGVVLWESMTGERLFSRDSDYQIWRAITEEDIPRVSSKQPGLPSEIDAVVIRALERDPARRYSSIRQFATDLRKVAELVGGPLDRASLANALRSLGAAQLGERAQLVSMAVGKPMKQPPSPSAHADVAITAPQPIVGEPSDTHSISLRDESVRLGGARRRARRRRWPWIATFTVAMVAGVTAAVMSAGSPSVEHDASVAVTPDAALAALEVADAAIVDDEVELEEPTDAGVEPTRKRPRRKRATIAKPEAVAAEPGQYSVDSKPYATIYIDGKSYGDTPLFRVPLAPGRHRIRAVRADGRVRKLTITIEPGKLVSSGTLAW